MRRAAVLAAAALALLGGCSQKARDADRPASARAFPRADRPVAMSGSIEFGPENERERLREAQTVLGLAHVVKGMTIADIGSGKGYYLAHMARWVGPHGRVVAQDIDANALQLLGHRVERERLDNVSITRGTEDDPKLPAASFDRIFLIHMYHEVTEPYAFLWHLQSALRPDGQVIVVEADHPVARHGMPPRQLFCEFAAVGFRLGAFVRKPELQGYYARFEAGPHRPAPAQIKPCRIVDEETAAKS